MKRSSLQLFITVLFACICTQFSIVQAQEALGSSIRRSGLHLVSRQFSFTEGPATDSKGNIYFTDQPNNKIWCYNTKGVLSVFKDTAGRSNGTYFDKQGNLITCADENNELWQINPSGKVKVLLSGFQGRKFNGPNDLWIDAKGGIYFTDPYYQRSYWTRTKPDLEQQRVYYLPKGADSAIIVAEDVKTPNGIVGSADGKILYVADFGKGKTFKYRISEDGRLSGQEIFTNMASDGMTIDGRGNLYLTGNGVTVFNSQGQKIDHIAVPEKWTANVCFGGKKRNILFITASEGVYVMKMKVKGVE